MGHVLKALSRKDSKNGKKHKQQRLAKFIRLFEYKEIVVFDIPDEHQFMDDELINILNE